MYKIKSISSSKGTNTLIVEFDNMECELSVDTALRHSLAVGTEIDKANLDLILEDDMTAMLKRKAHNYVSYKPRTIEQIKQYLANEGSNEKISEKVIDFLKDFDLVDDDKYAKMYINDLFLKKPMGRSKVINELYKRGVSKELISKNIKDYTERMEFDALKKLATKRLGEGKYPKTKKQYEKEMRYFISRGFKPSMINKILNPS